MSIKQRWLVIGAIIVCIAIGLLWGTFHHWWHEGMFYIQQTQNQLRRALTQYLAAMRHGGHPIAWWTLVSASFIYGILHAVGPGHGKAVISTFLLTQPSGYKHALWLSLGGALLQGVSAILWVGMTLGILQWFIRTSMMQVVWAERLSYLMIILIGIYIVVRQIRRMTQHHKHCSCGHHEHHHPPTKKIHWAAMLAIGARPCSGAILALAVAGSWGLWGIGIAMTMAMSIGTAITVLSLALLTVYGRDKLALNLGAEVERWRTAGNVMIFIGGSILIALGIIMMLNIPTTANSAMPLM